MRRAALQICAEFIAWPCPDVAQRIGEGEGLSIQDREVYPVLKLEAVDVYAVTITPLVIEVEQAPAAQVIVSFDVLGRRRVDANVSQPFDRTLPRDIGSVIAARIERADTSEEVCGITIIRDVRRVGSWRLPVRAESRVEVGRADQRLIDGTDGD